MRNLKSWVREQIPLYLKTGEYENFRIFLEAYYDFLEMSGQANDILFKFNETSDIDTTLDPFIKHFVEMFSFAVPEQFFEKKRDALKHVKEINSIKGTPNSYKLLFQLLFNEDIELYYPEVDIFRSSASDFRARNYISVCCMIHDATVFKDKWVRSANARFFVEDVELKSSVRDIWYLKIDETKFTGEMDDTGPEILWIEDDPNIVGQTMLSLSRINVISDPYAESCTPPCDSSSLDNRTGDIFLIQRDSSRLVVEVTSIRADRSVRSIEIIDQSINWDTTEGEPFTYDYYGIVLDFEFSAKFRFKGVFQDRRNQPSGQSKIQDGRFYSPYVYVVRTGQSVERWREIVTNFIHPAGVGLFSQIFIYSSINASAGGSSSAQAEQKIRAVLNSFVKLLYELTTYVKKTITNHQQSIVYSSSHNVKYFDRNKFLVHPYEAGVAGSANVERADSTVEYGIDTIHENFTISTLSNYTLEMFDEPHKYPIIHQPGSFIRFFEP